MTHFLLAVICLSFAILGSCFAAAWFIAWVGWVPVQGITPERRMRR